MSEKHKKGFELLWQFPCFCTAVSVCYSNSTFASIAGVLVSISTSAVGWKICTITSGIKKYKSIIKEMKKKQNKIT